MMTRDEALRQADERLAPTLSKWHRPHYENYVSGRRVRWEDGPLGRTDLMEWMIASLRVREEIADQIQAEARQELGEVRR